MLNPPSAARAVFLLVVALLVPARAVAEGPEPGGGEGQVEGRVEGFWVRPFPRASRLTPCGHGTHVWAWTPQRAELWRVDADGTDVRVALGEDVRVVDVLPTSDPERAWVRVEEPSPVSDTAQAVFSVDHGGQARRIDLSPLSLSLAPSEDHARLWAVSQFNPRTLWVIDPEGGVEPVDLSPLTRAAALRGTIQLAPAGDGRQGWVVIDQRLYQVQGDARTRPRLNLQPLVSQDVVEVLPTGTAQRAWVRAQQAGAKTSQVLLAGRDEATQRPTLAPMSSLPGTGRRLFTQQEGQLLWLVTDARAASEDGPALTLVDAGGRQRGEGVTLDGPPVLVHAPDGSVWARDTHRVYLLGDTGGAVARSEPVSELTGLLPVSAERAWAVSREGNVSLLSRQDGTLAVTAWRPTDLRAPVARAGDASGVWLLSDEETQLHRVRLEGGALTRPTPVLEGVGLGEVRPVAGSERFWIAGTPRSHLYGTAAEVRRVEVGFAGGARLTHDAGGAVTMTGTPVAGEALTSLELDWPGLAQAKAAGRTLRLEVRDEAGTLVGQGLRRLTEPEGLLFQWTKPPESAAHRYGLLVSLEVENGTRLTASFGHVPFGVPVWERMGVRTLLACLVLTLLLALPLLLARPTAAPRRWGPLLAYGASLVGVGGSEVLGWVGGLRIHVPTVLGVVSAEVVLAALLGLMSPAVFRRLVFTHPFSWAAAPLLRAPRFRRRFFAGHVRQVRRRVEVASAQANGEVFVALSAHVVEYAGSGVPPSPSERTPEELCRLLTHERAHLFIQCAGGRGKSALLRQLVRLSLARFEERPASPLPVFIDPAASDLESAAKEALQDLGLPEGLRDALLESGDFFLVLDGLTESRLGPEALRRYLEREMGLHAPLLLSARPNEAYRVAMSYALRWMAVEPRRLDEEGLVRFQAAYPDAGGQPTPLTDTLRRICRGRGGEGSGSGTGSGTYVPLLVRLALRFGGGGVDSVINLYRAVFAGLLKRDPDDAATSEMLAFAETLCLDSYWEHRSRLIVFRDSPDEHKLRGLLDAGLLVPADARPGPVPTHVRFFHDSMQSYLTARALYAQHASRARWDCLWRAAGEPGFAREQSDLMTEAGSELFQMCAYVFGYDARLKAELGRQLERCAEENDERLTKEAILEAVPEGLREGVRKAGRVLGPGALLREGVRVCAGHGEGEALFLLYARIAPRAWPWSPDASEAAGSRTDAA